MGGRAGDSFRPIRRSVQLTASWRPVSYAGWKQREAEARRQRIRADKAEAELELLKNIVRKMLDAQIARDGFEYVEAKELVRRLIK